MFPKKQTVFVIFFGDFCC